jgi:gliding motility-associated-like protein
VRHGIAATLFFAVFNFCAFAGAGNAYALKRGATLADTTKKDKPQKTNACNAIGNLTGNTCIGSTLTATVNTALTDAIASVEWMTGSNISLLMQTAAPFSYTPPVIGTYFVKIITKAGCMATSNSVTITDLKLPVIKISTRSNIVCADYPNPAFTGVPTYNGNLATYQWKVNYINVGPVVTDISQPFSPLGLKKGDVVTCEMTSTDICITTPVVQSDPIAIDDIPVENPAVSVQLNSPKPCVGSELMFTAIPVNGGEAPDYQWYVNEVAIPNANAKIFTSAGLKEDDRVTCTMLSNAKVCQASTMALSPAYTVKLIPLVVPEITVKPVTLEEGVSVTYAATVKNGGNTPLYQWQINKLAVGSGAGTFVAYKLVPGDIITCTLISNADCTTSNTVTSDPVINTITIPYRPATATLFTPNGDGVNDTWTFPGADAFRNAKLSVYNRYGQMVFHSAGIAEEWDGKTNAGKLCPPGVYYYFVNLDKTHTKSGAVTIIR